MASSIIELIKNPAKKEKMGKEGRKIAIIKGDLDKLVDRYMEEYYKIL